MNSKSERKKKSSEAKLWSCWSLRRGRAGGSGWGLGLGGSVSPCFPPEQRKPISCADAIVSVCHSETSVSFSLSIWSLRRGSSHSAASWKSVSQIEALDRSFDHSSSRDPHVCALFLFCLCHCEDITFC